MGQGEERAESVEHTIAGDVQESLTSLEALAIKVESFCLNKLAPITSEKVGLGCVNLTDVVTSIPYPPLFLEYRNKIRIIELSLLHIESMLKATGI